MPADERLGLDDHQGIFPVEQARPDDERGAGGVGQSSWLGLTLFIEGQLLSQEEDFGAESGMGTDGLAEEPQSVADQIDGESEERSQWAYRAGEESQHGASGWHSGARIEKGFLSFFASYEAEKRRDSSRHLREIERRWNVCAAHLIWKGEFTAQ